MTGSSDEVPPTIDVEKKSEEPANDGPPQPEYPSGMKVAMIMISLLLAMFLVALDRTIISTAIPRITDDFHSINDIGWYGSAYMLTNSGVQLLFGRIYKFYSTKWVFLVSISIFEIGSLLCGVAPSSIVLIIGRAIAGLGSAGVTNGVVLIMTVTVPLHKRPMYTGMLGGVFGIASIVGPLLGGVFTSDVSWRWCFYINLPIGAIAIAVILLILRVPKQTTSLTFLEQIMSLDPLGTICFLPSIICLIIALQWGGSQYPWSDGRVIALLTVFAFFLIVFVGIQIWKGDAATIPPRIITKRSIYCGFWCSMCFSATMMLLIYYLPIYFQAIKNASSISSGIRTIPLVLALVLGTTMAGAFTQKVGYYCPPLLLSPVFFATGTGLLTTLTVSTGHAKWIGYQILAGFGLGLGLQQATMAAQTVLPQADVSIGVAIMFFGQQLSGAIFLAVGQNLFTQRLIKNLTDVPGLDLRTILNTGATDLRKVVDPQYLGTVLVAYNNAIGRCFLVAVITSCIVIFGAAGMEWKSVKKNKMKTVTGDDEKVVAVPSQTSRQTSLTEFDVIDNDGVGMSRRSAKKVSMATMGATRKSMEPRRSGERSGARTSTDKVDTSSTT